MILVSTLFAKEGMGPEEAVEKLDLMDEVQRIVFPKRKQAEEYLSLSQSFGREMVVVSRGTLAFAKKVGAASEEMIESGKSLPTEKALAAIQLETWEFCMREYDRIYSSEE